MKNNEHACNGPKERSGAVTVSGTATVIPNLLIPITTLNHHVTAIAPPNGASLNLKTFVQVWVWLAARDTRRIDRNNSVLSYSIIRRSVTASQPQKLYIPNNGSTICCTPTVGQLLADIHIGTTLTEGSFSYGRLGPRTGSNFHNPPTPIYNYLTGLILSRTRVVDVIRTDIILPIGNRVIGWNTRKPARRPTAPN